MATEVLQTRLGMSLQAYVAGSMRQTFFKRPLQACLSDIQYQPNINRQQMKQDESQEEIIQARTKTVNIQTMYRDQYAQTQPYTPDHTMLKIQNPEVMTLRHLTYGNGLPASIEELDMIQINREKVWFQNCLPPLSDQANYSMRRKLMEQQQLREWNKKEEDIKKIHKECLILVQKGLMERQKDLEERNAQKIQNIKIKKTEMKNRLIAKIQRKKIKVLRKQLKALKNLDEGSKKRDIIQDYANFASKVYASLTRQGLALDKIANKYEVQPTALNTYKGTQQLSEMIKPSQLQAKISLNDQYKKMLNEYTRLQNQHRKVLKDAKTQFANKSNNKDVVIYDENIEVIRKAKARPPTPVYTYDQSYNLGPGKELETKDWDQMIVKKKQTDSRVKAIVFLQRIIRGRTQQNIMYEGKEKRLALIEQLLTVAKTKPISEQDAQKYLLKEHQRKLKDALVQGLQGEVIGQTLDYLSKQLVRIKQFDKISELVKIAQNDRRVREIQQAGQRHAEQILRNRQQYLYNQIMRMNQGTVDTYLGFMMKSTIENSSVRQAEIMANLRKTQMNNHLESFERRYNNNQTLIRDLVQSFLLPNIQRSKLIQKIQLQERRFKEAAKKSLQMTLTMTATQLQEQARKKK